MKIAVSAEGRTLDSPVAKSFGRCPYFLIVDSKAMEFEVVQNPGTSMTGGAGPAAGAVINKKGSKILLTGQVGPNAMSVLAKFGIEVVSGVCGSAREAVKNYKKKQQGES